jgi:hypothetical protein
VAASSVLVTCAFTMPMARACRGRVSIPSTMDRMEQRVRSKTRVAVKKTARIKLASTRRRDTTQIEGYGLE